jgi:hypothetical protein
MLLLESYADHERHLPVAGKFIIAQFDKDSIIVYQAFKDSIAQYAVEHQKFGGEDYDFERMTWLKPSFLWMMYYSGWAKNENQENVLAISMSRAGFDEMLKAAVMSTYYKRIYETEKNWKDKLARSDIQLQWEPYHDLLGTKTERKAIKAGLTGNMQMRYNDEWILKIENITPYVLEQQNLVKTNKLDLVQLPRERAYAPANLNILPQIDGTPISL